MKPQPVTLVVDAEYVGYLCVHNPPAFLFRLKANSPVRCAAHLINDKAGERLEYGHTYRVRVTQGEKFGQWWAELAEKTS